MKIPVCKDIKKQNWCLSEREYYILDKRISLQKSEKQNSKI